MKLKIKGSVPFFTPKKLGIVYLAALVICVAVRTLHAFTLIEPDTGFYSESNITVPLFFCVIVFAWIFCLVGSFLSKDVPDVSAETINGRKLPGIFAILLSIGFELDGFVCFSSLSSPEIQTNYSMSSPFAIMMRSGLLPRRIEMIFAFLSALYFLILGIKILLKKYKGEMKIFSLVTVFWGVARLVSLFVRQISFIRISGLFLDIAATAFLTIFLFSFCEVLSGVYRKDALWRVFGVGLPASLTCLTLQIPKLLTAFSGSENHTSADYSLNYALLIAGLFIAILFISTCKETVSQRKE